MAKINKLGVFSFAKFQAALFALLGLVAGIIYSFGGLVYDLLTIGLNWGTALAFLALIGMPVMFAIIGYSIGIIESLFYNLLVSRFYTIELKFEK